MDQKILDALKKINEKLGGTNDPNEKWGTLLQEIAENIDGGGGGGSSLPSVTSADNGDVLTVVEGEWAKAEPTSCIPPYNYNNVGGNLKVASGEELGRVFGMDIENVFGFGGVVLRLEDYPESWTTQQFEVGKEYGISWARNAGPAAIYGAISRNETIDGVETVVLGAPIVNGEVVFDGSYDFAIIQGTWDNTVSTYFVIYGDPEHPYEIGEYVNFILYDSPILIWMGNIG